MSHYIIHLPKDKDIYMIGDQTFTSLPNLLDFYKMHFLDTTTLIEPCPKQQDQREISGFEPVGPVHTVQNPPPLPPMDLRGQGLGLVCKALYNFKKTDEEDLAFSKGETLTIIRKDEDQWWLARNAAGEEGLVPAPYIKPISDQRSSMEGKGGGDGRLSTGEVSKTSGNDQYKVITAVNPNTIQHAIVTQERVPCAYDPTQLKLEVGSIIKVLDQNVSGNWKGEVNGKKGYFPFNRVRLLDQKTYEGLIEEKRKANGANA